MTTAFSASRSSTAAVSFSSPPKTLGHSEKLRFEVMTVNDTRCLEESKLKSSSPPSRSKGTKPSSSTMSTLLRARRRSSLPQLAAALRLDERAHEVGGAIPGDPPSLTRDLDAEGRGQVSLAGPDGPDEDDVLFLVDESATRQREHLRLIDARRQREVEGVDGEHVGKARLAHSQTHR